MLCVCFPHTSNTCSPSLAPSLSQPTQPAADPVYLSPSHKISSVTVFSEQGRALPGSFYKRKEHAHHYQLVSRLIFTHLENNLSVDLFDRR